MLKYKKFLTKQQKACYLSFKIQRFFPFQLLHARFGVPAIGCTMAFKGGCAKHLQNLWHYIFGFARLRAADIKL